ncbi:MAG: TonB system transport protein ExbD [Campylobacterota bacterium]|nr:TonB system transport protein ExbD [Campylobacterota bacterium]
MRVKKFDSINVVPFIDIMLVLLVIVLTTASFVAKGIIPLDLSTATSSTKIEKHKELIISIKADGEIYLNDKIVSRTQIEADLLKYKPQTPVSLNCDKNTKFDNFVYVIDILKESNFKNLSIITKQQ